MAKTPRPILHLNFARSARPAPDAISSPVPVLRPPRDTPANAPAMRSYVDNLESRLIHHVQRHTKRWIDRETGKILRKWQAPILQPRAPRGAPPRDFVRDARRYAEDLILDRVRTRLTHFHGIRQSRGFVHDPLGDRLRAVQRPDTGGPRNGQRHKRT